MKLLFLIISQTRCVSNLELIVYLIGNILRLIEIYIYGNHEYLLRKIFIIKVKSNTFSLKIQQYLKIIGGAQRPSFPQNPEVGTTCSSIGDARHHLAPPHVRPFPMGRSPPMFEPCIPSGNEYRDQGFAILQLDILSILPLFDA